MAEEMPSKLVEEVTENTWTRLLARVSMIAMSAVFVPLLLWNVGTLIDDVRGVALSLQRLEVKIAVLETTVQVLQWRIQRLEDDRPDKRSTLKDKLKELPEEKTREAILSKPLIRR